MVALRCLLVMYIVWLIISYTASHLIGATGSSLWPTSVWKRVRDLCECGGGVDVSVHEGKKAATFSRPNAQVKQLTSVTVGFCFCFFVVYFFKLLLLLWKTKAFPFQLFVSFVVGQNWYVMKMKRIYSFGAKL